MKIYLLILLLILPETLSDDDLTVKEILASWKKALDPYIPGCLKATNATEEMVQNFFECGVMSDDHRWKCALKCFSVNVGTLDPKGGRMNPKKIAELFEGIGIDLAQRCTKYTDKDLCEEAYEVVGCLLDGIKEKYPFE